jgi:VWFA-related protein
LTARRLILIVLLLLPVRCFPQDSATATIKVDTKLTVVDVTVTDKNGQPVHGLTQSDFTVKEDGKPQPIRNFNEFGTTVPPPPPAPNLPPGVYTNQSAALATGTVNILLFSQLGSSTEMIYARAQALNYLKTLPQGTRVAVLMLENGVRIVQNITTDRDVLVAAVNATKYQPVSGATFAGITSGGQACAVANNQSRITINALRQIAASFASIHGRKNLVWFTHGLPWLTNIQFFKANGVYCLDDDTQKLHEAYSMLSASQVAISTIDPRGLENASGTVGPINVGGGGFVIRQLNQESIRDFAEATGGTAYYNRNDLDTALGESIATNADYYAVSYTPPLTGYDGKYHTINVTVNRPGLHLQYRKGYTSLDVAKLNDTINHGSQRDTPVSQPVNQSTIPPAISQFRAAMAHGVEPSSRLVMAARIAAVNTAVPPIQGDLNPKVKPSPLIRYDAIYAIPPGQISLTADPDGKRKGSVRLDVAAYAEDGTRLNVVSQTANLNFSPEQSTEFQQKPFEFILQLDLPPGKLFVRVGALDIPSGKIGTLEVPQTVSKPTHD